MKNRLVESGEMRYNVSGGLVAQLVRALPCHGRGREFESRRVRQDKAFTFVEVLSWLFCVVLMILSLKDGCGH